MASAPRLGGGEVALDVTAFAAPFNAALVHECVRAEQNARRRGTAATKTRGMVRGGGAKPWRQKGTGRARAGSSRSPLWAGGGTTFGPSPRHYLGKVNRKARRAALRAVLSVHAGRGSLAVIDGASFEAPSTRQAADALAAWGAPRPVLVLAAEAEVAAAKSFRNLSRASVLAADEAGVADILGAAALVLTDAALEQVTARAVAEPRAGSGTPAEEAA